MPPTRCSASAPAPTSTTGRSIAPSRYQSSTPTRSTWSPSPSSASSVCILIIGVVGAPLVVGTTKTLRARGDPDRSALFAAAVAALAAFAVAAAVDWVWQLPAIVVAFLLVTAAVLNGGIRRAPRRSAGALPPRVVLVAAGLASLVAVGIPLAAAQAIRSSQSEVRSNDLGAALDDARTANGIEPYGASSSLQEALVLELQGQYSSGVAAASAPPSRRRPTGRRGRYSRGSRPRTATPRARSSPIVRRGPSTPCHPCSTNDRAPGTGGDRRAPRGRAPDPAPRVSRRGPPRPAFERRTPSGGSTATAADGRRLRQLGIRATGDRGGWSRERRPPGARLSRSGPTAPTLASRALSQVRRKALLARQGNGYRVLLTDGQEEG